MSPYRRKAQRGRSVAGRFSLWLVLVASLVLVAFAVAAIAVNYNRSSDRLDRNLLAYLNLTATALQVPMWNVDYAAAQGVVDALLVDARVGYAAVTVDDEIIARSIKAGDQAKVSEMLNGNTYESGSIPIAFDGEKIGDLHIAMSRSSVRDELIGNTLGILLLTLLVIAALTATVLVLVRRFVSAPLSRLQSEASRITQGDLNKPIGMERNDEIGRLAQDFDSMRGSVKTLVGELQTANQTLEGRVEDRTTKLRYANRQILDSVRYASRIQRAMLPSATVLETCFADHLLIWQPRDIVGGDFYWCKQTDQGVYLLVADCTGHGVPGAFMTAIATGIIERNFRDAEGLTPATMLSAIHRDLRAQLAADDASDSPDGLEAGICFIPHRSGDMLFAGARFALFHLSDGEVVEHKGARFTLGSLGRKRPVAFTDQRVAFDRADRFFLATDGLIDQIGGPRRIAYGKRRFRAFLQQVGALDLGQVSNSLTQEFQDYQGEEERRDDVTVFGFQPRPVVATSQPRPVAKKAALKNADAKKREPA